MFRKEINFNLIVLYVGYKGIVVNHYIILQGDSSLYYTSLQGDSSDPSSPKTEGRWNFLDQRKIDRTEPVIKPKVKGGVKRHKV